MNDDDINLREPRPLTKMRWADVDKGALAGVLLMVAGGIGMGAALVWVARFVMGVL